MWGLRGDWDARAESQRGQPDCAGSYHWGGGFHVAKHRPQQTCSRPPARKHRVTGRGHTTEGRSQSLRPLAWYLLTKRKPSRWKEKREQIGCFRSPLTEIHFPTVKLFQLTRPQAQRKTRLPEMPSARRRTPFSTAAYFPRRLTDGSGITTAATSPHPDRQALKEDSQGATSVKKVSFICPRPIS